MSKFTAIPDFVDDLGSIGTTLRAIKDIVEQLAGARYGEGLGAPEIFVQLAEPQTGRGGSILKLGDLWVLPGEDSAFSYFDGTVWQSVTTGGGGVGPAGPPGVGLPTGGTVGQTIRKNSGVDYDVAWETPTGFTPTFETVSKNLSQVDNSGEQIDPSTLIVTYANGIVKTIVDGGSVVTISLSGSTPGGIDLVKTITLTGDDFDIAYS